jgi:hypothetical protein
MKLPLIILVLCLTKPFLKGQSSSSTPDIALNGYVSVMPSFYLTKDSVLWQVLLHNRLNLEVTINKNIGFTAGMRNQLIGGDFIGLMEFDDGINRENYFMPLSYRKKLGNDFMLLSEIDRLSVNLLFNKLEIHIGRQRINWGQTFVWNPNDVFNTYNFFDFDYPERPGSDAIRIQYYTGNTSLADVAVKLDSAGYFTAGGLFKFTRWNTEFQVLAGYYSNKTYGTVPGFSLTTEDVFAGLGFSTGINTVSIRSEATYLYSVQEDNDSTNQFLFSTTVDYALSGNLGMMFEFFFVNNVQSTSSVFGLYGGTQNVKNLAFAKYNLFAQASYPFTPIISGTLGGMYFYDKDISGFYAGPSLELSLGDNLSLSTIWQIFAFKNPYSAGKDWLNINFGFLRLKWNF